jgi:hypothetical protein
MAAQLIKANIYVFGERKIEFGECAPTCGTPVYQLQLKRNKYNTIDKLRRVTKEFLSKRAFRKQQVNDLLLTLLSTLRNLLDLLMKCTHRQIVVTTTQLTTFS